MYKLIIEDDEGKTTVVPLIRDEITIGRKEGNTIRLTERNVSRRHAKLVKSNGSIYIEDLQSYNGIKVNGDKISGRATISEGDRIQIGDYQLALKVERQAQADQDREDATKPFIREAESTQQVHAAAPTQATPQISGVAPDTDKPGRVVVVSSNFAGQEFVLAKPVMVIGRTDDNDIVVNHRSISRHHAQIVREGTHYHIVDLQSANGVRVNGEDYGKVELRKGDHVDLGHVRMRFVAPGEDFIFARDAEVIDVAGRDGKKGKGGLIAMIAIGVVVLAGGGFAIMKLTGGGPSKGDGKDSKSVAQFVDDADTAMLNEDWDKAIEKCTEGLKLDPTKESLQQKKTKATAEKSNKALYEQYQMLVKNNNIDGAVLKFQELGDSSVYKDKGQASYANVKRIYVTEHLRRARPLFPAHCDGLRKLTDEVLSVEPDNSEAQELARKCSGDAAAPPQPNPSKPVAHNEKRPEKSSGEKHSGGNETAPAVVQNTPPPPPPPPQEKPAASDGADAEKLVSEAQDDYVHGNYAGAIEKAKKALKSGGSGSIALKAWRVIGTSSCFLKDKKGAVESWNRLDASGRQLLNYVCKRNAIDLQ